MANNDVRRAVQDKLNHAKDDLHRASVAFRGVDMTEQHGQSGRTRAAILAEYQGEVARWEAALMSLGQP